MTDAIVDVTSEDHVLGPLDAPVTLVEYAEFECPHCGRAYFQLKALRDRLPDLGARFVFRHLARDEVHPFAVRAAVTAEAAAEQGRFWEMHDRLFENQHALEYDDLKTHATEVGLDVGRFLTDMRDPRLLQRVKTQGAGAIAADVESTPSFFVNGRPYDEGYDLAALTRAIERETAAHSL